ncbi:BglG family transcription antiterminator [Actinomyces qiguomingii]|uniref:BglG family transcription antiterminator n=1 Tax=Actinomyces qiguomingii TaxID=2057800 RepID=UPI000FFF0E9B|nr:PTS sugar transporter subunit IIA [Actinomyces qiguomingii]
MAAKADRLERLVRELRAASRPMSARALAAMLQVTDRSIRSYVKELNAGQDEVLIRSTPSGYQLDHRVYRIRREREARRPARQGSDPRGRLNELTRILLTSPQECEVFELADRLFVSPSTLEGDLGRVRLILRDHELTLVRRGAYVNVDGPLRRRRRLIRQILLAPVNDELESDRRRTHLTRRRELTRGVRTVLANNDIVLNEYVLLNLCTHLYVAVEGYPAEYAGRAAYDADIITAARAVTDWVNRWAEHRLPESETDFVASFLAVSTHRDADGEGLNPAVLAAVRDCVLRLDDHFLLRLYDGDDSLIGLAIHVQAMAARLRAGQRIDRPFGADLQLGHPLVHELSVYFSHAMESALKVEIPSAETDFLALHLGARLQQLMDAEQQVTITLVVPRFGSVADDAVRRLNEGLHALAVVERLVTEIDPEVSRRPSDVVVTAVDLDVDPSVPVVRISPLCTREEVDAVRQAVLEERVRAQRHQVWSALVAFTDEHLFTHIRSPLSREEAIGTCHSLLVRAHAVDEQHLADVMDRERRASTAFSDRFAMPHSLYMDAARTALAVLTCTRPIPWGDHEVNLVIMLAVSPKDRAVFRDVLDELVRILSDPVGVDALIGAGTNYSRLMETMRELVIG